MKKLLIPLGLLFLICIANGAQAQTSQHALPKSVKAFGKVAKAIAPTPSHVVKAAKFSLSSLYKGGEYSLGSIAFAVENGVDVVHFGLDKADAIAAKVDSGLESAEQYFFGSSN